MKLEELQHSGLFITINFIIAQRHRISKNAVQTQMESVP